MVLAETGVFSQISLHVAPAMEEPVKVFESVNILPLIEERVQNAKGFNSLKEKSKETYIKGINAIVEHIINEVDPRIIRGKGPKIAIVSAGAQPKIYSLIKDIGKTPQSVAPLTVVIRDVLRVFVARDIYPTMSDLRAHDAEIPRKLQRLLDGPIRRIDQAEIDTTRAKPRTSKGK